MAETCSPVLSRTETASVSRDLTDGAINARRESTASLGVDSSSPPSLTSQPVTDTETTVKMASPSANDACCDAAFENPTMQVQSTTPPAVDDSGTRLAGDELGVGAVPGEGQAPGECPYVSF